MSDHKQILMLLSSNDVANVRRLLAAALHRGASAQTICTILTHAISGSYVPQGGFVQHDFDIALLVKSIGGPRLLYALQRSHGIPSWRTVGHNTKIPRLLPSIAAPTSDEIGANITTFFDHSVKPHPTPTPLVIFLAT
jgi:hypothetical protein